MTGKISDAEWDELVQENFDTTTLLSAVDAVDSMRRELKNGEDGSEPALRTDLLKLHQLAISVFNQDWRSRVAEMFDLAVAVQDQVHDLMNSLRQVERTLGQLTDLYPESLSYPEDD